MNQLKTILSFLFLALFASLSAQNVRTVTTIFQEEKGMEFKRTVNPNITILSIDQTQLQQLRQVAPENLDMTIPSQSYADFKLKLTKVNVFADDFKVTLSSGKKMDSDIGIHYSGHINGDPHSLAMVSIYKDHLACVISNHTGNYNLGKLKEDGNYILFWDHDIRPEKISACGVIDQNYSYHMPQGEQLINRNDKTVKFYVEGDRDLFQVLGSVSAVNNYLTTIMGQSVILYKNDGVTAQVSEIKIWDTPSPYVPGSDDYPADDYLETFRNAHKTGFNGDVAILLTGQSIGGGLAADIGSLCKSDKSLSMAVTDLEGDVKNVPQYSWDVSVVAHELGHLLGSRHTHACVWNGNNTQIDDCASKAYYDKGYSINDLEGGDCFDPNNPIIPANGGFIMSYCDFLPVGTNLSLGFGQQSATVIRNSIANAPCIGGGQSEDLSVSPNPLIFSEKGGCLNLNINSSKPWQIGYDADYPPFFLTKFPPVSGSGNATVELCAGKNDLPVPFGFPLYVTDGTNVVTVVVLQDSIHDPTALFYPTDKIIAKAEGDFVNLSILTNTDWKIIQKPYDTWVVLKSSKSGTTNADFNLEILKNSTGLNRFAKIGLVYNNALDTAYFTVSQPAIGSGYINVPSEFSVGGYENAYSFNVYSDLEWEITDISNGWMEPSPKKGKGNGTVTVNVAQNNDPNDRTGTLTFTAKLNGADIKKTVKINQLKLRSDEYAKEYKVYPNPASDRLNIQLNSKVEKPIEIALISSNGLTTKVLEHGRTLIGNYNADFDLTNIPSGYYTLVLQFGDQVKREKIIIIN